MREDRMERSKSAIRRTHSKSTVNMTTGPVEGLAPELQRDVPFIPLPAPRQERVHSAQTVPAFR